MRQQIETGEFYHIFNRGVDKRTIFEDKYDIARFLQSMREFNVVDPTQSLRETHKHRRASTDRCPTPDRLVNVVAYCLNPNHYHFILQQLVEGGVSEFMKRVGGGYTNYFNIKHDRSGSLFQGKYKYKHIETEDSLKYLSVYVNLNDRVHGYSTRCWTPVSSWDQYIEHQANPSFSYRVENKQAILGLFSNTDVYKAYAGETLMEIRSRREEYTEML